MAAQKDPLFYRLLKRYVTWQFHLFYRTEVSGLENIPENAPLIFIANHQNALMDALAILCTCKKNPWFLARSDVFKSSLIARILYFFKMLPVFRFRDGYDQLRKNEAIFEKSCHVLINGEALVIMPEGNHDPRKRLRAFKKGLAKIAFSIYETGYQGPAYIVPVGLEYASHHSIFSRLLIQYGKPVPIQNYVEKYHLDPAKAQRILTNEVRESLMTLVIHIEDEEVYEDYIRWIYWNEIMFSSKETPDNQKIRFSLSKELIEEINLFRIQQPELYEKRINEQKEAEAFMIQMGCFGNPMIFNGYDGKACFLAIVLLILFFPFFLYGWLTWVLPYSFGHIIAKQVKDKQFNSSVAFVAHLTFYALQTCMLTVILITCLKSIFPGILFVLTLYPAKKILKAYRHLFEKTKKCVKAWIIVNFRSKTYKKLQEQRNFFSKKFNY
ncbi:MAG: 1-acyl-sn-glycerol-3-phosphate acyltransferase [Cyclobacteriaceae bacterium]|nr:1-acyl-sn-glycerol-3-phosphate acyltransferase [Cyclobacteriaceae bacterium]